MPFGAMRHGFTYKAAVAAFPSGSWVTSTEITHNYLAYQNQKLDYVGADSSSRPVFLYGYVGVDGYTYATLFRRNSDGTITYGTPLLVYNAATTRSEAVSGYNSGNTLIGVSHYTVSATSYAKAYTIDKDNLALGTPGTEVTVDTGNSGGFSYISYAGNGTFLMGARLSGIRQRLYTVSGTTLTGSNSFTLPFGDGVYQHTAAFDYQSDSYYRIVGCNGNDGSIGAGHFYNTTAGSTVTQDVSTLGLAFRDIKRINSTNTAVMVTNNGTTIELVPFSVTWPTGGSTAAPTLSVGTAINITEGGTNANIFDGIDNSLVCVYRNSSGVWKRVVISASGTTLTQGSAVELNGSPDGYYANPWGKYVSTPQGNLLMLIMDGGTGTNNSVIYQEVIA